jgi:hypothetical protein
LAVELGDLEVRKAKLRDVKTYREKATADLACFPRSVQRYEVGRAGLSAEGKTKPPGPYGSRGLRFW